MRARLWGTRGSLPTPSRSAVGYGGNTSCVAVQTDDDNLVILDAGTGIAALGAELPGGLDRIDILLTHLHMDHIIGLGFFAGLFRPGLEVHLWGPRSTALSLGRRLTRYLSPPLFPVRLRDLPCRLILHDVPDGTFDVPGLKVTSAMVCHPGPTVGYRLDDGSGTLTYLPDHEPALGARHFPDPPAWTSGFDLAAGVDVLIHDAQYSDAEYAERPGWGHSAVVTRAGLRPGVRGRRAGPVPSRPQSRRRHPRCDVRAVARWRRLHGGDAGPRGRHLHRGRRHRGARRRSPIGLDGRDWLTSADPTKCGQLEAAPTADLPHGAGRVRGPVDPR